MDYYNGNQKMKVFDYSSGDPEHKRFAIITRDGDGACKIIVEPDEDVYKRQAGQTVRCSAYYK